MLKKYNVTVKLGQEVVVKDLQKGFDEVVIAAGVRPRKLTFEGADRDNVLDYGTAINHPEKVGQKVAVIGAGGIGFDVSELLTHQSVKDSKIIVDVVLLPFEPVIPIVFPDTRSKNKLVAVVYLPPSPKKRTISG